MTRARPGRRSPRWIAGALPLLLVGCGESPRSEPPLDAESLRFVRTVQQGLARGQRPEVVAIQRLKELGLRHPSDPVLSQVLLELLPPLRDWDGLARWLEAKGPLEDAEQVALCKVYLNLADYEAAWRAVAPLADRRPEDVEANTLAGRAAYLRGDGEAAARHLDRVWPALVAERRVEEQSYRAMLHLDAGELERARAVLEDALAQDADSPHVHSALSRVLTAVGDTAAAEEHGRRATELQAAFAEVEQRRMRRAAQNQLLNETWARGEFDRCRELVLRFLTEADAEQAEELLAFLESMYTAAGRADEAPAVIASARALVPVEDAR